MIKLRLGEESEKFRCELSNWLKTNRPPADKLTDTSLNQFVSVGRAWQQQLAAGKWLGVYWPEEYGGRGLSLAEEAIVQEELLRVSAPQVLGLFGITMVGPVIIRHGTLEQKARFLPKILTGEEIWCQGFSEPGAGSDLAAVKTKAEKVEGGFLLSGQKIWTSFAHVADWCFIIARTNATTEKKHEGLTYFLVDMRSPGITVRPLKQISGDEEFNEVFFDSVHVPKNAIVGEVGKGWSIAISTLMYERVVLTFSRQLQSENLLRALVEKSHIMASAEQSELASGIAETCAIRALAYEHLLRYADGAEPGPEGSIDKLLWSESFQKLSKFALGLWGQEISLGETAPSAGAAVHRYLYSLGRTIAAGTSEIQRNIIAERILGLPRLRVGKG